MGIYVDAAGTIYVSLTDKNKIVKGALIAEFPYVAAFPTIRPTSIPPRSGTSPPTSKWDFGFVAVAGYSATYGGYDHDGVLATSARLRVPTDIAFDGEGHMHIVDYGNTRVRRVDKYTGIITTIAGTGVRDFTGDGSSAVSATFSYVSKIAFDPFGDLFILDFRRIRKIITATGIISTVAGNNEYIYHTGGAPAMVSSIGLATHIACDPVGNLFILDTYNAVIWKVDRSSGIMTVAFGNRETGVYVMGNYYNLDPTAMAHDAAGDLYLSSRYLRTIVKVTLSTGAITLFAPRFEDGESMLIDSEGDIHYMEISVGQVRKITVSTGVTTIVARNQYFTGSICADSSGKIYVAGTERHAVFLVPLEANPQVVTAATEPPTTSPTPSPTVYPTGVQIGSRSIKQVWM
jgi:sugar lactone lactonase YvrE